jgi:hypothetical protein
MLAVKQRMCSAAFVAFLLGALSACGGGGGSSAPAAVASTNTFSIDAAYKSSVAAVRTVPWTISGNVTATISGVPTTVVVSGSGTLRESGLSSTTFNGKAAQARTLSFSGTLQAQGQSSPYSQSETVYLDANLGNLGSTGSTTSYASAIVATLPIAAKVGESGNLMTLDGFVDASKLVKSASSTVTWALLPDTATTALLQIIVKGTSTAGVTNSSVDTYRITPTGTTTRVSLDSSVSGQSLKFTFN